MRKRVMGSFAEKPFSRMLPALLLLLAADVVSASPMRWEHVSPERRHLAAIVTATAIVIISALIAVMLVRHWRQYRVSQKGLHPWLAVGVTVGFALFWVILALIL